MDSVLVTIDLFSNRIRLKPINSNFSGDDLVNYFVKEFFPVHGFPQSKGCGFVPRRSFHVGNLPFMTSGQ